MSQAARHRRPTVHVTDDVGAVSGRLLADAVRACISETGRCVLGVPGGGSPVPTFEWLADHLDPEGLVVTWVDERHLPTVDGPPEGSNLRTAWDHWFSRAVRIPEHVAMLRPGTLQQARDSFARDFAQLGGLDVALIGMGPDGHLASLFPDHPALRATEPVIAVTDSPKPPPERLTLSLPVLADVRCAVIVATGEGKAPALARAWEGDDRLPIGRYVPRGDWHWVLDRAAAAPLRLQESP